ncbi:MAG: flap endonuclease-1 [Candidatus Micrarchaeota archaeon]
MGVDLGDLAVKNTVTLQSLSGKVLAVDAFNTIYQFLASIRQEDGNPLTDFKGNITSHLSGLFFRNSRLIENGIKLVYVFDGVAPKFKKGTRDERAKNRLEAEGKWKKALEEGDMAGAKKFAQASSRLTQEMVEESKELISAMGIPYIQAPSEGEAQAAMMAKNNQVYASASQDYDSLLFGAPLLVRNINITGKRKVPRQDRFIIVEPEEIRLEQTLKSLAIDQEKLIYVGLLVGTDFNAGVPKVGPKTALKIVKEVGSFSGLKEYVKQKYNYEFEEHIDEVYDFFTNPPHNREVKIEFGKMDHDKISKILVERHDFSLERVEKLISDIEKVVKEKGAQSKLGNWFG